MPVFVSLLRGVNLGAHDRIKMDVLRDLYEWLGFSDVKTYVQSGNVVFRTKDKDETKLRSRIEAAIEKKFGFHPDVVLRTAAENAHGSCEKSFCQKKEH